MFIRRGGLFLSLMLASLSAVSPGKGRNRQKKVDLPPLDTIYASTNSNSSSAHSQKLRFDHPKPGKYVCVSNKTSMLFFFLLLLLLIFLLLFHFFKFTVV